MLAQLLPELPPAVWIAGGVALALLLFVVVLRRLRRGVQAAPAAPPDLRIRVQELPSGGPPPGGPQLEFYGTPVRLAVVVLASAGRQPAPAEPQQIEKLLESVAPGLAGGGRPPAAAAVVAEPAQHPRLPERLLSKLSAARRAWQRHDLVRRGRPRGSGWSAVLDGIGLRGRPAQLAEPGRRGTARRLAGRAPRQGRPGHSGEG